MIYTYLLRALVSIIAYGSIVTIILPSLCFFSYPPPLFFISEKVIIHLLVFQRMPDLSVTDV